MTSQLASSLRMWPCSVCTAVFTHENGKIALYLKLFLQPLTPRTAGSHGPDEDGPKASVCRTVCVAESSHRKKRERSTSCCCHVCWHVSLGNGRHEWNGEHGGNGRHGRHGDDWQPNPLRCFHKDLNATRNENGRRWPPQISSRTAPHGANGLWAIPHVRVSRISLYAKSVQVSIGILTKHKINFSNEVQ